MDGSGKARDIFQQLEPDEMVRTAGEIPATLAGPDQDSMAGRQAELADLQVEAIVMKGDFAADSDSGPIGTDFV